MHLLYMYLRKCVLVYVPCIDFPGILCQKNYQYVRSTVRYGKITVEALLHPLDFQLPPGQPGNVSTRVFVEAENRETGHNKQQNAVCAKTLVRTKLSLVYCISHLWQDGGFCFCVSLELFGMVSEVFLDPWANLLLSLVPFVSMRVRAARVQVTGLLMQAETIR